MCAALNIVGQSFSVTNRAEPHYNKQELQSLVPRGSKADRHELCRVHPVSGDIKKGRSSHYETQYQRHERTGFGGGFKIPEEFRTRKQLAKQRRVDSTIIEDEEAIKDTSLATREEILETLNLGTSDPTAGVSKSGTDGKTALSKDLMEVFDKDMKKFKMLQEAIQDRGIATQPGGKAFLAETDEDRKNIRIKKLQDEMERQDAHPLYVGEERL